MYLVEISSSCTIAFRNYSNISFTIFFRNFLSIIFFDQNLIICNLKVNYSKNFSSNILIS